MLPSIHGNSINKSKAIRLSMDFDDGGLVDFEGDKKDSEFVSVDIRK